MRKENLFDFFLGAEMAVKGDLLSEFLLTTGLPSFQVSSSPMITPREWGF